MPLTVNKVQILGSLGKDAETRTTTSGKNVTSFSVATNRSYKGKDGNWVNETDWHNVVAWELSEFTLNNLKKGSKVFVDGEIAYRSYEKDGQTKYITEIKTNNNGIVTLNKSEEVPMSKGVSSNDLPF